MWPRIVEMHLAVWLALSPFIFAYPDDRAELWVTSLGVSLALLTLAAASFWRPLHRIHLLELLLGAVLIGTSYLWSTTPPAPAVQNHMVLGLLILMSAIIPSNASLPPTGWDANLDA